MALSTKPPDFEEMNIYQLKQALEQQLFLLNKMGDRLPDSGEKLTKSVARLKFLISKREKQIPPSHLPEIQPNPSPRPSQRHGQKLLTARGGRYPSPKPAPTSCTAMESELDSLVSTLSILNIRPENPVLLLDSEDCQDEVPRLSADEVRAWRRACNLPTWDQDQCFRWFTFRLRRLTTGLVSLTVLDCHRPDRIFTRAGALSTWPILRKTSPSESKKTSDTFVTLKSHNYSPTTKVTVSEAVSDLWCFLGDLLKGDQQQQQGSPVLLCASPSTAEHNPDTSEEDDFVRFRRLFVAARHRLSARSGMPRDLLMVVVTGSKDEEKSSHLSQSGLDEEDALAAEANACRALRDRLFGAAPSGGVGALRPGGFSAFEFFPENELRTCVWLEAPLNLFVLRKIAVPPEEVDSNPPFVPTAVFPRKTHKTGSPHSVSVPARPLEVEDVVLRRLAATGFCSSSLAFLAGTGGWRGFAGLLSAPAVWGLPNDIENNSQQDSGPLRPLVTANHCLLRRLYAHFRRVYKGLVLNASHYEEAGNRVKPWSSANSKTPEDLKWAPGLAASIVGWTGAPAGLAPRQLQTLSIQESIDLMDRVRQDYLALWRKLNLPTLPKMPPESVLSQKYRETTPLDTDDDGETLSADESDRETVIDE